MATRKVSASQNPATQLAESFEAVCDAKRLRRLAELMNEHDLSEIELRWGELQVRLRRGAQAVALAAPAPAAAASAGAVGAVTAVGAGPAFAAAPAVGEEHVRLIKSPMVGTFYLASGPDVPPFVKVGDHVGPDSVVCIVEAMKVFNEIPAEVSGRIVSVLVDNGEPVEYGQPLFKVDVRK